MNYISNKKESLLTIKFSILDPLAPPYSKRTITNIRRCHIKEGLRLTQWLGSLYPSNIGYCSLTIRGCKGI